MIAFLAGVFARSLAPHLLAFAAGLIPTRREAGPAREP